MKIHTFPIVARYDYRPDLIPEHGSPLYDRKLDRAISPTTTVRVGTKVLTPKQIVYALHQHAKLASDENPNPCVDMPMYLLNRDENPSNIRIENLLASNKSRRWSHRINKNFIESDAGALVPKHLLMTMTEEDRMRLGLHPNDPE